MRRYHTCMVFVVENVELGYINIINIMDGMLTLFETICHSDYQDSVLRAFLKACNDQQVFVNKASNAIQPIVSNINSKLNSATSRLEGLLLLKTFLPQCSIDIFGDNVMFWMQLCLKIGEVGLNKYEASNTAYQVLKILLQMSDHLPEIKRKISSGIVPKIIENFQHIKPEEVSLSVLDCLEQLMYKYGSACGQQRDVLEKCIIQYLDCKESDVVKRVAHCLAYLPLLGGGGAVGSSHIASWKQHQQTLCATLHGILDELFDDIREIPNSYSCATSKKLDLPEIKETSSLVRVHILVTRFINISKCLQAMLVSKFPVEKTVLPDAILGVVCRGLAVNNRSLGKKISPDVLMISAMLPQLHITMLRLLDSLVICCRRNLLPYAPLICRMILQTLKWTSEEKWLYGMEKPYCQLREAACNSLKLWLQVSNSGSCVELIADQILPLLIQDIWYEKESVTLIAQKKNKGNKSQRKTSGQEQVSGVNVRNSKRHVPNETANNTVCRAALQLLQWILHSAAPFLKSTVHRVLQEKTIGTLFEIQRSSNPEDLPVPFSEPSCRLELYQLLYTLNIEPHTIWPPPTQFTLHMLAMGRDDTDLKVSAFCTSSLVALEKIIHPSRGTLQFPVDLDEILDSTKNYNQEFVIPLIEHTFSIGESPEKNINIQNDEVQVDQKSTNDVEMKESLKKEKENINSFEDVEIVCEEQEDDKDRKEGGEGQVEEELEEQEEEEDEGDDDDDDEMEEDGVEYVENEECSEFEDEMTDDSIESICSLPKARQGKSVAKKFQEERENDNGSPLIDIAESDDENNVPTIDHKQNVNLRNGSK
ncbi:hypothetical protein L9F63_000241 [Diploptera punctata]|uniref:Pre-rRNA-processing protein RIX1 N-terminal domain-containing protein n=1 Tax=Diploptera punctata TaxID=6984 RepID=A0AAD8ESX0_DIPPU|nr:hypothetical protein L9F63_000241 [Diploptera punctata]